MSQGSLTESSHTPSALSETSIKVTECAKNIKEQSAPLDCNKSIKTTAGGSSGDNKYRDKTKVGLRKRSGSDSIGGEALHSSSGDATTGTADEGSDTFKKRKLMLRQKMSKLLAYESPSPLSPLPQALSPASRKDFKVPVMRKKV